MASVKWVFRLLVSKVSSAGIAAQTLLVLIVVIWTGSYLFRVVTGQMTYMEQRRRYRGVYDEIAADAIQARFDAPPEDEQQALLRRIGAEAEDSPSLTLSTTPPLPSHRLGKCRPS